MSFSPHNDALWTSKFEVFYLCENLIMGNLHSLISYLETL